MSDREHSDAFKERLIMVEQQQNHQKETLIEINDALREVVKTQHILANQRKELDHISKEQEYILRRLHDYDIEDAKRKAVEEHNQKLIEGMNSKIVDEIEPQQNKTKFYMKLAATIMGAGWAALLVFGKWWLDNAG